MCSGKKEDLNYAFRGWLLGNKVINMNILELRQTRGETEAAALTKEQTSVRANAQQAVKPEPAGIFGQTQRLLWLPRDKG